MKSVLMLATTAAMIDQFNRSNIELLNEMGYKVDMIGNFDVGNPVSKEELDDFKKWMAERGGNCYNYSATRHPLDFKNNIAAYKKAVKIVTMNHYDLIHCHNPLGAVIGRFTAHTTHTSIVYTAHGFHFFEGAPLKNWLFFYPVEKFLSRWTDALVLINKEDYERARNKFHAKRTYYVPGIGVDIHKFENTNIDRNVFWKANGIDEGAFVIVTVGELIQRKNHEAGIRALGYLKEQGKLGNINLVICGKGPLEEKLNNLSSNLGVQDHVHLLGFRRDIPVIQHCSDAFLFMSYQEGLSVAMMEAMASGLPIVCSKIRGNIDLIEDGVDGMFAKNDSNDIAEKLLLLQADIDRTRRFASAVREESKKYSTENIEALMRKIYGVLLNEQ